MSSLTAVFVRQLQICRRRSRSFLGAAASLPSFHHQFPVHTPNCYQSQSTAFFGTFTNFRHVAGISQKNCSEYLSSFQPQPLILSSRDFSKMADNKFIVGYAKLGTSSCKKCKTKIEKGALRIGKVTPNPFSEDGGDMKQWFHPACIFETFVRARATTKKIEDPDDLDGFGDLKQEDKDVIKQLIEGRSLFF